LLTGNKKRRRLYDVPETAELSAGTNTVAPGIKSSGSAFPALANRDYRFFFGGQFISVIGTWLQIVAQAWLVLQHTSSPFLIGLVAALSTLPSLMFALFGGVLVDRYNKKQILYCTQGANTVLALTFGMLTMIDAVSIWIIGLMAFLMGTVNAIDAPARQAFVSTIVKKDQLASAIALNSGMFNAARAIGPAIAGLLIASVGSGPAFILNGLSYLSVLVALRFIHYHHEPALKRDKPLRAIVNGIKYTFTHPLIRVLIIFTGILSIFGWSYSTLVPLMAKTVFGVEARGLGYLYTATGLGSLLATFLVGAYSRKIPPIAFILGGNIVLSLALVAFSLNTNFAVALALLFLIGLGLLSQAATMNTLIQTVVRDDYRGRVMSVYVLMFLGFAPIGNFEVGFITEHLGITATLIVNAIIVITFGLLIFRFRKRIRNSYEDYKRRTNVSSVT
jgi:MFS family permease